MSVAGGDAIVLVVWLPETRIAPLMEDVYLLAGHLPIRWPHARRLNEDRNTVKGLRCF